MALDGEVSLEKGFLVKTFSVEEAAKGEDVMKGESNRVRQSLARSTAAVALRECCWPFVCSMRFAVL